MTILEKIAHPKELKNLSHAELEKLAKEIRHFLVETVSLTGGHLASSLGVVELAIALLAVLECPQDKIIWDVGHQSYAYKILTGRRGQMETMRKFGGLSGFPRISESEYDAFSVGHASTAISAALGIAKARDLKNENFTVAAVVGDGSLSGGLAFEAINNVGQLKTKLIVILNDNGMSISPATGSLSKYITQIRTSRLYNNLKTNTERILSKIPKIGVPLAKRIEHLVDRSKHLLMDLKFGVMFEEFGFKYLGPIDGHNIPFLMGAIKFAKDDKAPVIIHILTKKGKGYSPAEGDPTRFHGIGAFSIKTGESKKEKEITYTEVFGEALVKLAEKNKKIVAVTAAMAEGAGLVEFAQKFPERFFDVGIAEEHGVTFAAGLANQGMRPVVAIYSTFLQRAYDQIILDVCLDNYPVVFCLDRSGLVGPDGPTHHGVFDLAYLRTIPNLTVMAPKDGNELRSMLALALELKGPAAIRYPKAAIPDEIKKEIPALKLGEAEIVYPSAGLKNTAPHKIAILAIGSLVYPAVQAAQILEENQNISSVVINARFLKPLDEKMLLDLAANFEKIFTVEEGLVTAGFGSAVLEFYQKEKISPRVHCLGLPEEFPPHGENEILLEKYGLTPEGIARQIINCLA